MPGLCQKTDGREELKERYCSTYHRFTVPTYIVLGTHSFLENMLLSWIQANSDDTYQYLLIASNAKTMADDNLLHDTTSIKFGKIWVMIPKECA